jgi:hypothetical protein
MKNEIFHLRSGKYKSLIVDGNYMYASVKYIFSSQDFLRRNDKDDLIIDREYIQMIRLNNERNRLSINFYYKGERKSVKLNFKVKGAAVVVCEDLTQAADFEMHAIKVDILDRILPLMIGALLNVMLCGMIFLIAKEQQENHELLQVGHLNIYTQISVIVGQKGAIGIGSIVLCYFIYRIIQKAKTPAYEYLYC